MADTPQNQRVGYDGLNFSVALRGANSTTGIDLEVVATGDRASCRRWRGGVEHWCESRQQNFEVEPETFENDIGSSRLILNLKVDFIFDLMKADLERSIEDECGGNFDPRKDVEVDDGTWEKKIKELIGRSRYLIR